MEFTWGIQDSKGVQDGSRPHTLRVATPKTATGRFRGGHQLGERVGLDGL
jgi:hypothetical protein